MVTGMSAMPGLWADEYLCTKGNEIDTIKYMLELHSSDFPCTCCVGFTIVEGDPISRIYPKVRSAGKIRDFFNGEITDVEDNI